VVEGLEDVGVPKLTVIVNVVEFRAALLSFATTLMVFEPGERVIERLQLAVPRPVAVSPFARTPFTVTDETPLSPLPVSVAVPETVIVLVETV
jgi:hypothetical protein